MSKDRVYTGDTVFSTSSKVIYRNVHDLPPVICKQKSGGTKICEFDDFVTADINGFGDEIGSITNRITEMKSIQSNFDKDSDEYKELEYRIICGQLYQQNAIDKIKSIESKPMPKEWYVYRDNIIEKTEKGVKVNEFNIRILADKKPYFFIYNYQSLKREYKKFMSDINTKSITTFKMTYEQLIKHKDKTEEMLDFIVKCNIKNPVEYSNSTMNRLCWYVESELDGIKFKSNIDFDYNILKTEKKYKKSDYKFIEKLYKDYVSKTNRYSASMKRAHNISDFQSGDRDDFKQHFIDECSNKKIDSEDLCNIVLDICYTTNKSKQFAWDISGEQILKNLLKSNDYIVHYPELDDNGYIEMYGHKFTIKTAKVGDEFAVSN